MLMVGCNAEKYINNRFSDNCHYPAHAYHICLLCQQFPTPASVCGTNIPVVTLQIKS